jgi:hypothetical protein
VVEWWSGVEVVECWRSGVSGGDGGGGCGRGGGGGGDGRGGAVVE